MDSRQAVKSFSLGLGESLKAPHSENKAACYEIGVAVVSCEPGNETSVSMKGKEFLD
jgi:hypothetical protein